ncbi:MAG: polysaccharide biosynthesis/export family protein [Desulfobacteraceae bacterium]|jgi:protein involved in polysaccharide export with SLBB domain
MMKFLKVNTGLLAILSICALFAACSSQNSRKTPAPSSDEKPRPTAPYVIRPGDQLDIKFYYNTELNESVDVRPDGKITLQLVDDIQAAGFEPAELDELLTLKYSQELKDPEIAVIVKKFSGQRIYVGGEVNQQREMELPTGMTVLQAVFQAGGFKETASPQNTILIRQGKSNEPVPIRINLKKAMYGKGKGANLALRPNDILYIPKSGIAKVNKFVNQYIEKLILFRGFSAGVSYQINKDADLTDNDDE